MTLTRQKFLSDDELEATFKLLDRHKGTRDSILIRLALFSGARSCEILQVKPRDLDSNTVTIFGAKGSNDRTVPLPPDFFTELQAFVQAESVKAGDLIFPITTRHFRRIWSAWRPARNPKLHGLRHTLGVNFYRDTRDIHATKTLLGHRACSSTFVYLDYIEGAESLAEKMQGVFKKYG